MCFPASPPESKLNRSLGGEGLNESGGAGKQSISHVGEQPCCRGMTRLHFGHSLFQKNEVALEQMFLQQYGYFNDIMHTSWVLQVYE